MAHLLFVLSNSSKECTSHIPKPFQAAVSSALRSSLFQDNPIHKKTRRTPRGLQKH